MILAIILREIVSWMVGTILVVSFVALLTKIVAPATWTPILIIVILLWFITLIARTIYLLNYYKNKIG